mgnify:FL=1
MFGSLKSSGKDLDFDQKARDLWAWLNLNPQNGSGDQWNPIDPIFRHKGGGGTIYVGNQTAAGDLGMLRQHGITHVVNCTHGSSGIPCYHQGTLKYYIFPVILLIMSIVLIFINTIVVLIM